MITHSRKAFAALGFTLALALAACGGGATGGTHTTAGIALPSEISALPASASQASAVQSVSPGGDYAAAETVRFVDERALAQFDILNTIFGAVAQTHYADPENVDAGPYGAVVSWIENNGDREEKRMVRWVVDSRMATVDGQDVNQVKVWFFEPKDGVMQVIKVQLDIFQAPTRNEDGSYADYGVWTINAKIASDGSQWFTASADHVDGLSRVMIHETENGGSVETSGILLRSAGQGYGKVTYPDWNQCNTENCTPPNVTVSYVYDPSNVALRKGATTLFKSRLQSVDVVRRYGLFDAVSGANVTRTHTFGFPLRFTQDGLDQYAFYGAWQGRHQLWANGATLAPGTTVTRADGGANPPSYVTSDVFQGVLTRRTYADSSTTELAGMVLNTWIGEGAQVSFDGTSWTACVEPRWNGGQSPTCSSTSQVTPSAYFTAAAPENVSINHWNQQSMTSQNLVWQSGHFWVAVPGQNGQWQPTSQEWIPQAGDSVWVNRNGPVFLTFDGDGWWKKQVVAWDPDRNAPTFGAPEEDTAFTFVQDRDYNLNANGVTYIYRDDSSLGVLVKIERQDVPNPVDAATFVPSAVRFRRSWGGDTVSTFRFGTDPAADGFLQLTYATVGPQDQGSGRQVGDVVAEGVWNLVAEEDGVATGEVYSWDYPSNGNSWAVQQYLERNGAYVVLDDPIRLAAVSLTSWGGQTRNYALQFDGQWLNGVPDAQQMLREAGGDMSQAIADQIVNVPEAQRVADALDPSQQYVFKPLQVSQFLLPVADPGNLDLTPALALDLALVPDFQDPFLPAPPQVTLKYSEGQLVQ